MKIFTLIFGAVVMIGFGMYNVNETQAHIGAALMVIGLAEVADILWRKP